MPKTVLCAICSHKIPYGTIHADLLSHHPRFGRPHPGQNTIACPSCGRYLHVGCVEEAGTSMAWHHLWFSNMRMRAFIEEHRSMGQEIALCKKCHGELSEQIVANYKAMEKFAEGARFLEEFGWTEEDASPRGSRRGREVLEDFDEAYELLAEIKN